MFENFSNFFWRGGAFAHPRVGGPPPGCTLRRRLAGPRRWRESASFAVRAPLFELCIVTGPSTPIIHLNLKNSPKIEILEIFNFFSPKTCSGSWTFIKYQVQPYCICSLGAYSPRTDGRTDGRTACSISWSRYLIITPLGFDNVHKSIYRCVQGSRGRLGR